MTLTIDERRDLVRQTLVRMRAKIDEALSGDCKYDAVIFALSPEDGSDVVTVGVGDLKSVNACIGATLLSFGATRIVDVEEA